MVKTPHDETARLCCLEWQRIARKRNDINYAES